MNEKQTDKSLPKKGNNPPQLAVAQVEYQGPIPPAEQLRGYEDVCPGAADRIIRMAEEQAAHRQNIERQIVDGRKRDSFLGIMGAFLISVAVLIGGVFCISRGHDEAGTTMVISVIVGLCTVFIKGTSLKQDENRQKRTK